MSNWFRMRGKEFDEQGIKKIIVLEKNVRNSKKIILKNPDSFYCEYIFVISKKINSDLYLNHPFSTSVATIR